MHKLRQRLRVQLVSTSITGGGAEAQLLLIAKKLLKRGHAVTIVSLCDPEVPVPELEDGTIPFTSLGMQRGKVDLGGVSRYVATVRTCKPDVVHSHMFHASLLTRLGRVIARAPVHISTAHNFEENSRWRNLAYRVTDPLSSVTTVVCARCVNRYVERGAVPRSKAINMPNGMAFSGPPLDPAVRAAKRTELNIPDGAFVWMAAGRFVLEKDYQNLLRAVSTLLEGKHKHHIVLLAGDGSLRAEIETQITRDGLNNQVQILGFRNDVRNLMEASDGLVVSSASEGLPMVLLEAAAARLPSVVTDVGGNNEIVIDGSTGYVVPPSDHVALAGAMVKLASLPKEELEQMGQRALDHSKQAFDIEVIVDRWEALYYSLLSGQGTAADLAPE